MRKNAALGSVVLLVLSVFALRVVITRSQGVDLSHVASPIIGSYNMSEACYQPSSNGYHRNWNSGSGYAVDASVPIGTPVYSPVSGTVDFAGNAGDGYGNRVTITDSHGYTHFLAHMHRTYVDDGETVTQGQLIGLSGDTGNGPAHLHWHVHDQSEDSIDLSSLSFVNVTNCNSTVVGTISGANRSGFASCPDFYANAQSQGMNDVALFDHSNCRGNYVTLPIGSYDWADVALSSYPYWFDDRTRSMYIPPGKSVYMSAYAYSDYTSYSHCHSNDMWDLDSPADKYDNTNTQIGFQGGDGSNMISYVAIFNNSNCDWNGSYFGDVLSGTSPPTVASIGGYNFGGNTVPDWLFEFSKDDTSVSSYQITSRVNADPGVYDAHRILVNGNQLCETSAAEQTCTLDASTLTIGNQSLEVQYRRLSDNGNWATALNYTESFYNADNIPPTTTDTITGTVGNNGWYVSGVQIDLVATDNAGVAGTYYSVNGGGETNGNQILLPNDGIYQVDFWSIDVNGMVENTQSRTIFVDQTPPTTTGTVTGPRDINGIFRDNVTADILSTDNLSGVAFTNCSSDNRATWQNLAGTQIAVNGNGVHQFFCYAEDVAGNVGLELDSGPIIINMYVVFNRSATNGFHMTDNTNSAITGDVYSEGQALIERNTGVHIYGTVEVVNGSLILDGSNVNTTVANTLSPASHVDGINYPFAYYWDRCNQYHPSGLVLNSVGNNISGVICVNGDLTVTTTNVAGNVVFVVTGNIDFNPTQGGFTTSDPANGMIMYSLGNTLLRGNGYDFNGLVYAGGNITNSSTDTVNFGSYVAENVTFSAASGITLFYDAAFSSSTYNLPLSGTSFYDASGGGNPAPTPMPTNTATNTPVATNTPTNTPTATTVPVPNCSLTNEWTDDDQASVTMVWTDGFDDWHTGLWGDGDDFTTQHDASGVQTQSNRYQVDEVGDQLVYDLSLTINGPGGTHTCYLQIDFATNPMWVSAYGQQPTNTATSTVTATATVTSTATDEPVATNTATATLTPEPTNTATATSTATATQSVPAPTCTLNYSWADEDHVDVTMSWTGGFDENRDIYWGDGDDSSISDNPSDSDSDDHWYTDVDEPGAQLVFTISYTINGPGGSITCSQTIDFATNPYWIAEFGS